MPNPYTLHTKTYTVYDTTRELSQVCGWHESILTNSHTLHPKRYTLYPAANARWGRCMCGMNNSFLIRTPYTLKLAGIGIVTGVCVTWIIHTYSLHCVHSIIHPIPDGKRALGQVYVWHDSFIPNPHILHPKPYTLYPAANARVRDMNHPYLLLTLCTLNTPYSRRQTRTGSGVCVTWLIHT